MFDELKILITGDASGIESTMKQALNIMQGGISAMNDQTVDWTSIFSRAVSPAIISSVASVFAFAIAQSTQFQMAMNQTGTAAGLSTTQIGAMGAASQQLASQTGQSANDIGSAFAAVAPVFSDTAVQQTFVSEASQLAASGFGNLSDIVQAALPIMQAFGVTTSEQVTDVFTDLMHGAQGSGESFSSFAGQFSGFIPNLIAGGAKIGDLNKLLSGFSAEVANLGLTQASAAFNTFSIAVSGSNPALNALLGSSQQLLSTVRDKGLPEALAGMGDKIEASGKSAVLLYTNFGLSTAAIDGLEASAKRLPAISADADKIANSTQSITDAFNQSDSAVRHLMEDWETLRAQFTSPELVNFIDLALKGFMNLEEVIKDIASKGVIGATIDGIKDLFGIVSNFSDAAAENQKTLQGEQSQIAKLAGQQGVNISPVQAAKITSEAGGNDQLIMQLLHALSGNTTTPLNKGNATFFSTFNLTVPKGATDITAKAIAQQIYNQFNGTQ